MKALIRVTKTIAAIFALYLLFVATPVLAQVVINSPTEGPTYGTWNPSISWNEYSGNCEYNYSGNGYFPLDCAQNGADLPPPDYNGTWSLEVRGYDAGNDQWSSAYVYNLDIQMYGCTDSNAINYSSYAVIDDNSCYYLQITNPTFEENVNVWSPAVNWGVYSPTTCEYSYDNSSFTGVDCNSGGSDIPAPSPGSVTLYVTSSSLSMGPYSTNLQFSYNPSQGIVITAPASSSIVYPSTWLPSIDWGDYNSSCEYSYDNSNWNYTGCVTNGSDIGAPASYGTTVLHVRGYDGSSNLGGTSVEFQYDSEDVSGCTNSEAINYNSNATIDDGSCYYIEITTPTENGTYDNWSPAVNWGVYPQNCEYQFDANGYNTVSCSSGGSDIPAPNEGSRNLTVRAYYPNMITTFEDSVYFTYSIPVSGCTNPYAINYNSNATIDDGSCYYIEIATPAEGGTYDNWSPVVNWGVSPQSCEYKFDSDGYNTVSCSSGGSDIPAPTEGSRNLSVRAYYPNRITTNEASVNFTYSIPVSGCTNPYAINYNSNANSDDGSCYYIEITSPTSNETIYNWSPVVNFGVSASSCQYNFDNTSWQGVTCGYNGSDIPSPGYGSRTLYIQSTNPSQGTVSTSVYFTYNEPPVYGCTNSYAINYNPNANSDDGSCYYIDIISPTPSETVINWSPNVNWGVSPTSCEYTYDNMSWYNVSCGNNGSDIPAPPSTGGYTLYTRANNPSQGFVSDSVYFAYPNLVSISSPSTDETVYSWSPSVSWGDFNSSCEYSYDNSTWYNLTCGSNGADIPAPGSGSQVLYVRGTSSSNLISSHSVSFTYSPDVYGCTNSYAINYDSNANMDDGSCYYIEITSPTSNETVYNWSPVINFGVSAYSCQYNFDNGGWTTVTCGNNGSDISAPSGGSRTLNIQSVNPSQGTVNTSVSFTYLEPVSITSPTASETVTSWSPVVSWGTYGYTCQYSYNNSDWSTITCANNGSDIPTPSTGEQTLYVRATTESNLTSNADVTFTYEPPVYGCTNSYAINYNSNANTDDGSCYYIEITSPTSNETITSWSPVVNFGIGATSCGYSFDNMSWTTVTCGNNGSDISDPGYGSRTMYVRAENPSQGMVSTSVPFTYNEPPIYGCTDSYAINYNSGANTDDGSCYYISITSPTSNETVTSWSPSVNFGVSVSSCEYNFNGSSWTTVTCGNNGSDIPTPSSSGSVTMDVRANNPGQGIVSTSVSFSYMQSVSITSPTSNETVTSWSPVVSWGSYGNDGNCQYSYNNSDWYNLNCGSNGSDIPTPSTGAQTLYVRGVTASNLTSSASVSFTYDPPVYGCTSSNAINYNSGANTDDGSCYYIAINSPTHEETVTSWSPSVNWGVYSPTTCEYSFDGSTYETVNCANNGSDISGSPSTGGNTLYVRASASDIGPYSTSTSFTYIAHVGINSPVDSAVVHEWNPVVSWGSYTSTCQVSLDGGNTYTNVTCSQESIGSEIPAPAPGTVNLYVRGYLNDSPSVANVTYTYMPYSNTPSQPDLANEDDTGSSDTDNVTSQGANLTISGSGTTGATITVCMGGCSNEILGQTTVNGPGDTWTYELPTLSEGTHSITATALESGKATSTESTALVLTIDQTGPSQTSTPQMENDDDTGLSNSDGNTSNGTPRFTVSCEVNSTVSLLIDNTENTSSTCSSGSVTIPVVGTLAENSYSITTVQTDVAGNPSAVSNTTTVTIDQTAPVISSVASSTTDTTATISWSTDENATSSVRYGITTSYGLASSTNVVAQNRSISLSNLAPSTTYHFELASTDLAGNRTVTSDYTFTTRATPDTTPPTITSSVINGTTTVLTLSEILSSTSTPNISTFTLGGTSAQITSVDISGSTVTLTLNQSVLSTETITLSYVAPVSGKIQDPSGNPLAGFSNRALTNQTPAVAEVSTPSQSSSAPTAYATSGGMSFTAPTNVLVIGTRASGQVGPAVYVAGVLNSTTGAPLNNGYGGLTNTYTFDSNIPAGRRDEDIKNLQRFLNAQGFRVNPIDGAPGSPGYETDLFGALTRQALARFQAVVGITPVGFFGPKTRAFINNFLEKNAPAK